MRVCVRASKHNNMFKSVHTSNIMRSQLELYLLHLKYVLSRYSNTFQNFTPYHGRSAIKG